MLIAIIALTVGSQSCVSKRLYRDSERTVASLRNDSTKLAQDIADQQSKMTELVANINDLNSKIKDLNNRNAMLGQEAVSQQSQLNQSKETLEQQRQRLMQLQNLLSKQEQESQALKTKMSDALNSFNSKELTVTQKNGKVYVSLSEALLFPSGSAVVNPRGVEALAKLAAVLNLNPDISVNIEGHTDSIPIRGKYKDNWDLSTARANAIVRILVDNYFVDPKRVEASGHSSYDPVDANSTPEGRARNRRTEIILSPKLDEMYKLLGES